MSYLLALLLVLAVVQAQQLVQYYAHLSPEVLAYATVKDGKSADVKIVGNVNLLYISVRANDTLFTNNLDIPGLIQFRQFTVATLLSHQALAFENEAINVTINTQKQVLSGFFKKVTQFAGYVEAQTFLNSRLYAIVYIQNYMLNIVYTATTTGPPTARIRPNYGCLGPSVVTCVSYPCSVAGLDVSSSRTYWYIDLTRNSTATDPLALGTLPNAVNTQAPTINNGDYYRSNLKCNITAAIATTAPQEQLAPILVAVIVIMSIIGAIFILICIVAIVGLACGLFFGYKAFKQPPPGTAVAVESPTTLHTVYVGSSPTVPSSPQVSQNTVVATSPTLDAPATEHLIGVQSE